jgi:hypothetical protein
MGLAAKKGLQVFDIHLLSKFGVSDGLKCIGSCLVALLLLGALLLDLVAVLGTRLLLLQPGRVVLDPDVLLQLPLLLVEDELVDLLRVDLIRLPLLHLHRDFALALLEDTMGHVAKSLRVFTTVFLVPLTGLLKLTLDATNLSGEDFFGDVEVIAEVFPGDLIELVAVGNSC